MKSLSKSEAKATSCEYHYGAYYVDGVKRPVRDYTQTGTDFHHILDLVVRDLVKRELRQDDGAAEAIIEGGVYTSDAKRLARQFVAGLEIDPETVVGTELFWAVDKAFRPVRGLINPGPGRAPKREGVDIMLHGTLDRVELFGDAAVITDYKSGFMPSRVDEYEAIHYAVLAFAHMPQVNTVTFRWEFVRSETAREETYSREGWADMVEAVFAKQTKRDQIRKNAEVSGRSALGCDPLAGLCTYCDLLCPVREYAARGDSIIAPIQTDADAVSAAGFLEAMKAAKSTVETQLKNYLADRGGVDLGNGSKARMETSFSRVLSLPTVMNMLGIEVPVNGAYDVPLSSLKVGWSELNSLTKAKKRQPLRELIEQTCPTVAKATLRIGECADDE